MGRAEWTSTEERDHLEARRAAVNAYMQLPVGQRPPGHWSTVYEEYFAAFPTVIPTQKEIVLAGGDDEKLLQITRRRRKDQIYNWYVNRHRDTTSGQDDRNLLNISTRTRRKQHGQTYMKIYEDQLLPKLKAAYARYETKQQRKGKKAIPLVAYRNQWAKARYSKESEEIKGVVQGVIDGELDVDDILDNSEDEDAQRVRHLQKRLSNIQRLVPTLTFAASQVEKLTGFKISILAAGIDPVRAGLTTFALHHGTSIHNQTWDEFHQGFDEDVHGSFKKWAGIAFKREEIQKWSFKRGDDMRPFRRENEEEEDEDEEDEEDADLGESDIEGPNDADHVRKKRPATPSQHPPAKRVRVDVPRAGPSAFTSITKTGPPGTRATSAPTTSTAITKTGPPGKRTVSAPTTSTTIAKTGPPGTRATSAPTTSTAIAKTGPPGKRTVSAPTTSTTIAKTGPPGTRATSAPTTSTAIAKTGPPGTRATSALTTSTAIANAGPPGKRTVSAPTAGPIRSKRPRSPALPSIPEENDSVPRKKVRPSPSPINLFDDNDDLESPARPVSKHKKSRGLVFAGVVISQRRTRHVNMSQSHSRDSSQPDAEMPPPTRPRLPLDKGKGRARGTPLPSSTGQDLVDKGKQRAVELVSSPLRFPPPPPSQYRREPPSPSPPPRPKRNVPTGPRTQPTTVFRAPTRLDPTSRLMTPSLTQSVPTNNIVDLPDWFMKSKAFLLGVSDWPEYVKLVGAWEAFERRMGLQSNNRITTTGRPAEIGQWIRIKRRNFSKPLITRPETTLPTFISCWRIWYLGMQPMWRGNTWPLRYISTDIDDDSWAPVQYAGPNGFFLVVFAVASWLSVLPKSDSRDPDILEVISDVLWLLRCIPPVDTDSA